MLDKIIQKEFSDSIFKAIKKYAAKYNADTKNIRVFFSLDESGENVYQVYEMTTGQMKMRETVGFKELLGIKIDILKKSQKIPPIINLTLLSLNSSKQMEPMTARMMMSEYEGSLRMCLFQKDKYIEDITAEQIAEIISQIVMQQ
jgi:hypothetical protein